MWLSYLQEMTIFQNHWESSLATIFSVLRPQNKQITINILNSLFRSQLITLTLILTNCLGGLGITINMKKQ